MSSDRTIVYDTPRLVVRLATEADAGLYWNLWTNPQVMPNVGFPIHAYVYRVYRDTWEEQQLEGPAYE